jgi:uncharacterized protein YjcR
MPNFKAEQKEQARYLYFTTNKTQKEIARVTEVSEQTMSAWVREENWAEEKKKKYHSPGEEIHHLYEQLREINNNIDQRKEGERYATKEELDIKAKILALISAQLKNEACNNRNVAPNVNYDELKSVVNEKDFEKRNKAVYPYR